MSIGVPTRPATTWHGPRAQSIKRLGCFVPALAGAVSVLDVNRSGVLLAASEPLRVGSSHAGHFQFEDQGVTFSLRVSYVASRFDAATGWSHRIGLSFRLDSPDAWQLLEALLSALAADGRGPSAARTGPDKVAA
jgi:hypothetical protein